MTSRKFSFGLVIARLRHHQRQAQSLMLVRGDVPFDEMRLLYKVSYLTLDARDVARIVVMLAEVDRLGDIFDPRTPTGGA